MAERSPLIRVFDLHVARRAGDDLEFLLLLRSDAKIYAGTWRMVGGKLEGDEACWQAALRELGEETNLVAERLLTVPYVNRFYEWKHDRINDIPVFVALVGGADPSLDAEHSEFVWLSAEEAVSRLPWPGQREGLKAAHALLTAKGPLMNYLEIDPALIA